MSKKNQKEPGVKSIKFDTLPHVRHCSSCEKFRTWTSRSEALNLPLSDLKKLKRKIPKKTKGHSCECETLHAWMGANDDSDESVASSETISVDETFTSFKSGVCSKRGIEKNEEGKNLLEWLVWRKEFNAHIVKRTLKPGDRESRDYRDVDILDGEGIDKVVQSMKVSGRASKDLDSKLFIMYGIPRVKVT